MVVSGEGITLEAKLEGNKPPVAMQKCKFNFLFYLFLPFFPFDDAVTVGYNQNYPEIIIVASTLKRFPFGFEVGVRFDHKRVIVVSKGFCVNINDLRN